MNRPWAMIASAGSNGLAVPLPSASTAHVGQVPGMNWAMPCAPTAETARGLKPDSWASWAASSAGLSGGQRSSPAPATMIQSW